MKAIRCLTPGDLQYQVTASPEQSPGHTILKIRRIGICGTDLHAFEGTQPYFNYPRILGHEISAVIEWTDAPGFSHGGEVTFIPYFNCHQCVACRNGLPNCCTHLKVCGVHVDGGMVEYYSVPNEYLMHGADLTLDALALIEPLAIGAHAIRRASIRPGENVLVVGAGPIGLGIMEFARIAGAEVIALDVQDNRLAFCREKLNIKNTINGKSADTGAALSDITKGDMPTVVIDATGSLGAINQAFHYMAHGGRYVLVGLQKGDISFSHPEFHKREGTLMSSRNATREDFNHVIRAMQSGAVKPETFITHRVTFDQVCENFKSWLDPANAVVKAMVSVGNAYPNP